MQVGKEAWNDFTSSFGGGADSNMGNDSGLSGSTNADMLSDDEIRGRILNPVTGKVLEEVPENWVENIRNNLERMKKTAVGRAMLRSIIRNERNFIHGGDYLPVRKTAQNLNAFDLNLNSPDFFTQEAFRDAVAHEISPERQEAASTEMIGVRGDTILGHEEANFLGVGEAATIMFVEGPMRDANQTPRRSTDRGQRLTDVKDEDKISFQDMKTLLDAARN